MTLRIMASKIAQTNHQYSCWIHQMDYWFNQVGYFMSQFGSLLQLKVNSLKQKQVAHSRSEKPKQQIHFPHHILRRENVSREV